jgi:hypothetical protein
VTSLPPLGRLSSLPASQTAPYSSTVCFVSVCIGALQPYFGRVPRGCRTRLTGSQCDQPAASSWQTGLVALKSNRTLQFALSALGHCNHTLAAFREAAKQDCDQPDSSWLTGPPVARMSNRTIPFTYVSLLLPKSLAFPSKFQSCDLLKEKIQIGEIKKENCLHSLCMSPISE